jgi:class 3 adenylate cyclase
MFCDLTGSTERSQALDREELREVNRSYQDVAKAEIERYGGYVARYMGDGVLVYFGYPNAHEDDAGRAIRAGLYLTAHIPHLNITPRLAVRVGVATGPVMVGDLIDEGASQESAVVGETPNLAARLRSAGGLNMLTIADTTRALVAGLIECTDLGMQRLKGFAVEPQLWRVVRETQTRSRFEALRSDSHSSFVGRDGELALLMKRWQSAVAGEGQVVLIASEAGIGKSRLAGEVRRAITPGNYTVLHDQRSSHHVNTAFAPFIAELAQASDMRPGDSVDARLDELEPWLPMDAPERDMARWLFATLLCLPTDRYPPLTLESQEVNSQTIVAIRSRLAALCATTPVLLVFEDVHWVDPSSLEVLSVLVQAGQDLPILFIVTHRPEFVSPWGAYEFVTRMQLSRLPRRAGVAIIRDVAGGPFLPDAIVEQILNKTDGVALFVEELTKTVLEGRSSARTGRWLRTRS